MRGTIDIAAKGANTEGAFSRPDWLVGGDRLVGEQVLDRRALARVFDVRARPEPSLADLRRRVRLPIPRSSDGGR